MFDLKKLDELKEKLMAAGSFADVMDFFFDHCGENLDFMALGKRVKSPLLTAVIQRVGEELLGTRVRVTGTAFILLKKQRFIHGTGHINGRMIAFFFFKDIDMGLLGCHIGDMSKFVRFTSYTIQGGEDPMILSLPTSRLTH